ncbi:MAG: DUF3769 domain-containing protein [Oscillatoria princeps RMCB-10]|nr:DUF3769 domain-containing protein [Oscillatoria princeps RMCB-10]
MLYPVPPPEPSPLVDFLAPSQVPHPGVLHANLLLAATETPAPATPPTPGRPDSLEPEGLQSSSLPALQRNSRASLLQPPADVGLQLFSPSSTPESNPSAGRSPDLFPAPATRAAGELAPLSLQSLFTVAGEAENSSGRSPGVPPVSNREPSGLDLLGHLASQTQNPPQATTESQVFSKSFSAPPPEKKDAPVSPPRAGGKQGGERSGERQRETDAPPQQPPPGTGVPVRLPPMVPEDVVELTADRQEYDERQQIITAEGNVVMRFRQSVLDADRLQINLLTRTAVAEGNVALRRGEQALRGQRFEYNFFQETGTVRQASGELYTATSGQDFSPNLPLDVTALATQERPLSDRILASQPQENITNPGGVTVGLGAGRNGGFQQAGAVRRLRYQADRVDFTPEGGVATNIRFTNDPFSPPELEMRADKARWTRLSPYQDEIVATRPRAVFDGGLSVPILKDRTVIDRRERDPAVVSFGYDRPERGGVYAERSFYPISQPQFRLKLTPQFYIQRAFEDGGGSPESLFGMKGRLNASFGPRTTVQGSAVFRTFDLGSIDTDWRASLRLRQQVGTHSLTGEYSYRDRLFNGSLGYQTVQSAVGAVLTSPRIALGNSGINLNYQLGAQYINADTDRLDLLEPVREDNRVDLSRFQASATLTRGIRLWKGTALPPSASEGLKYTPVPVVPYLQVVLGLVGVTSAYTSGDSQSALIGSVGLLGQFGHFSRPWLDYTAFNLVYSQVLQDGASPFLFDRIVDTKVLGAGISQQLYGPFRVGFQTSINLDTGEGIDTDYLVEYSRRTYGIVLRYNPVKEIGSLTLRISDFNWTGGARPFYGDSEVRPVEGGVRRDYD